MGVRVCVIGAGIVGLSCATVIQERFPNVSVTIIAEKFSPGTTSDVAAGLWLPYLLADTPESDIYEFAKGTWKYLEQLWNSPIGGKLGVSLTPCIRTSDVVMGPPVWKDVVYGFQEMSPEDLASYNKPQWKDGHRFVTYICEGSKLLPHLLQQFRDKGGVVIARKVENLEQIASEFDVIVNCSGLGAKYLVEDQLVHPVRGQIFRVKAPWQKSVLIEESEPGHYIIPNQDSVVLGGTHDKDEWDVVPKKDVSMFIQDGCRALIPSLEGAEVLFEFVGLRPGRQTLRVELEKKVINGKRLLVIHDYGHGGSGLTLFYGCALRVADLLEKALAENLASKL